MRSGLRRCLLGTSVTVLAALALFGCATTVPSASQSGVGTATLQTVQGDFDQAELQAEATTDALNELRISDDEDIPLALAVFSRSVDIMEAAGQRIIDHADGMYLAGPSYFVEAAKPGTSCEFPRLKASRNTNPAQLGPYFDEISDDSMTLKRAYRAFDFDISNIRDYLVSNSNANERAIESLSVFFRKAQVDSVHLEAALERALAALDRAKAAKAQAQMPRQATPPL